MGRQCRFCRKSLALHPYLSFHKIPKTAARRKVWLSILGIEDDENFPKCAEICSDHFNPSDIITTDHGTRWLKPDAVPDLNAPRPFSRTDIFHDESSQGSSSIELTSVSYRVERGEQQYFTGLNGANINHDQSSHGSIVELTSVTTNGVGPREQEHITENTIGSTQLVCGQLNDASRDSPKVFLVDIDTLTSSVPNVSPTPYVPALVGSFVTSTIATAPTLVDFESEIDMTRNIPPVVNNSAHGEETETIMIPSSPELVGSVSPSHTLTSSEIEDCDLESMILPSTPEPQKSSAKGKTRKTTSNQRVPKKRRQTMASLEKTIYIQGKKILALEKTVEQMKKEISSLSRMISQDQEKQPVNIYVT